jgi:nitroreductase
VRLNVFILPRSAMSETPLFSAFRALTGTRQSCRAFLNTPVPRATIVEMLTAIQRAPSDCNTQPWRLFLLSGAPLEALRQDLYEAARSGQDRVSDIPPIQSYTGVYQDRRRACGWVLYEAVGIAKGDCRASSLQALENFRFFGAPHVAIVTSPQVLGERGIFDTGIYLGHLLLAAQSLGLACVAQGAIAHHADVLRRHAPVPEDHQIICGLSFGYGDKTHAANSFRTERAALDEMVTFLD